MPTLRALLGTVLVLLLAVAVPPAQARKARCPRAKSVKYTFSLIVNPFDPLLTSPLSINAAGTIAGIIGNNSVSHPYVGFRATPGYSRGDYTREVYPGANQSYITGINSRGHTSGGWRGANGTWSGYVRINGTFKTFSYSNETGISTDFSNINDADVVGGVHYFDDGCGCGRGKQQGFLWNALTGAITPIKLPNTTGAYPTCVNNVGSVSVMAFRKGKPIISYLLKAGIYYPVAFPGATETVASCVNDQDEVVGSYTDRFGADHGFVGRRLTSRCPEYQTLDAPIPNSTTSWSGSSLVGNSIVGTAKLPENIQLGLLATRAK